MVHCKSEVHNWYYVYWELNQILSKHWLWLESNGEKGVQGNINWKTLPWIELPHVSLRKIIAEGVDFSGADLRAVDFREANLRGASFSRANIVGANFTGANLHHVDFRGAIREIKLEKKPQWEIDCAMGKQLILEEYARYKI
jgi:hypothetical protein